MSVKTIERTADEKRLIQHPHMHLVNAKYGNEVVDQAFREHNAALITSFLTWADTLKPGVKRMIVNGEWVDVQTDHLGDGPEVEVGEWENFRDAPAANPD